MGLAIYHLFAEMESYSHVDLNWFSKQISYNLFSKISRCETERVLLNKKTDSRIYQKIIQIIYDCDQRTTFHSYSDTIIWNIFLTNLPPRPLFLPLPAILDESTL